MRQGFGSTAQKPLQFFIGSMIFGKQIDRRIPCPSQSSPVRPKSRR
jgi:hypothetical protein